ncbi:Ribosomal RNA processing protein 36-like [Porphyridium purpureum]|uniref:rRNA biogenesis protein RRP36 n=1 Tax=Porphyridium purpureum TaxID=35688 RepID=A0A5J4YUH1_PORPP|nr:Ribosomal RNA processing protein 36-like [Porphyridium purpureum]|eukprot:POR4736..scf227_4
MQVDGTTKGTAEERSEVTEMNVPVEQVPSLGELVAARRARNEEAAWKSEKVGSRSHAERLRAPLGDTVSVSGDDEAAPARGRKGAGDAEAKEAKPKSSRAPVELSARARTQYLGRDAKNEIQLKVPARAVAKRVDPRFVEYTGRLSSAHIRNAYGFVEQIREQEIETLQTELRRTRNPQSKDTLKQQLDALLQAEARRKARMRDEQVEHELREKEKLLVMQGKTPYFAKKGVVKELQLKAKFDELKKTGKLKKFVNKKRKARESKEKKLLPRPSQT